MADRPGERTPAQARTIAKTLVQGLAEADNSLLEVESVSLHSALTQVLFTALRARGPMPPRASRRARRWARLPLALRPRLGWQPTPEHADVLAVLLTGIHWRLFEPVARVLAREDAFTVTTIAAGRAMRDPGMGDVPRLDDARLSPRAVRDIVRTLDPRRFARATGSWTGVLSPAEALALRHVAHDTVVRLGIESARLEAIIRRARPRVVVAYDEIDAWGRLLASAARRHGIPSIDLPHAEAVDVEAIRGAEFDVMAVFGRRSASVLRAAGVPSRVVEVGAARFDQLVHAGRREMVWPPRIVVAGQYLAGSMTPGVSTAIVEAAVAAASSIAPATVRVLPHPTEAPARWKEIVAGLPSVAGASVVVEEAADLHALLPGAALLVTGWSNSVFEAIIAGVPALTVHVLDGEPPMPFAAEGLSIEVRSAADAAHHAARLIDPPPRAEALASASAALEDHLGPLDGRATERTAALVRKLLAG